MKRINWPPKDKLSAYEQGVRDMARALRVGAIKGCPMDLVEPFNKAVDMAEIGFHERISDVRIMERRLRYVSRNLSRMRKTSSLHKR